MYGETKLMNMLFTEELQVRRLSHVMCHGVTLNQAYALLITCVLVSHVWRLASPRPTQARLTAKGSRVLALAAHPGFTGTNLQTGKLGIPGLERLINYLFAMRLPQGVLSQMRACVDPEAKPADYYGPGEAPGGGEMTRGVGRASAGWGVHKIVTTQSSRITWLADRGMSGYPVLASESRSPANPLSKDRALAERLWKATEELLGETRSG